MVGVFACKRFPQASVVARGIARYTNKKGQTFRVVGAFYIYRAYDMDSTQNEVPSGRKRNVAISIAFLVIALVLVGFAMTRGPQISPDPFGVRTDKKVLQETRYLAGTVTSVTNGGDGSGSIVIQALIKDMNTGSERYIEPEEVRMIERSYAVAFSKGTVFLGKSAEELVAGDRVAVETKESIYKGDMVTALTISYFDPQEEAIARILGNRNLITGTVREVRTENGQALAVIAAEIPDEAALRMLDLSGAYSVPKTERMFTVALPTEINGSEIILGKHVRVVVREDVYEATGVLSAVSFEIK